MDLRVKGRDEEERSLGRRGKWLGLCHVFVCWGWILMSPKRPVLFLISKWDAGEKVSTLKVLVTTIDALGHF